MSDYLHWTAGLALVLGCSGPSQSALPPVPPPTLEEHVRFMTEQEPTRDWEHPDVLDAVAEYIGGQFEAAGGRVETQDYAVRGETYRNVRAFFGPAEGKRLVIGAHYDVAGHLPGADDNASGVAALMDLAHRIGDVELTTQIELVAFSLEEPPFFREPEMGSAVHARSLVDEGVEVLGMINFEMVGYFTDEPDSQEYPLDAMKALYPNAGNFITVVGRPQDEELLEAVQSAMGEATELPVVPFIAPASIIGVDLSDHLNYWDQGFSALMITDTSFYRNSNYHTENDTADTLDYRRMELVVEGAFAAVMWLAAG